MSTTNTRFRRVLVILALVIGVVVAWQYAGRWGHTPPFRSSTGVGVPGSIAEMRRMKLGEVEQSVTIRGRSANAPILIWLHGGPGQDETGLWRRFNAALEDHFLVVYRSAPKLRTTVPETSVNEYCQEVPGEGDVHGISGSAKNLIVHRGAGIGIADTPTEVQLQSAFPRLPSPHPRGDSGGTCLWFG